MLNIVLCLLLWVRVKIGMVVCIIWLILVWWVVMILVLEVCSLV